MPLFGGGFQDNEVGNNWNQIISGINSWKNNDRGGIEKILGEIDFVCKKGSDSVFTLGPGRALTALDLLFSPLFAALFSLNKVSFYAFTTCLISLYLS